MKKTNIIKFLSISIFLFVIFNQNAKADTLYNDYNGYGHYWYHEVIGTMQLDKPGYYYGETARPFGVVNYAQYMCANGVYGYQGAILSAKQSNIKLLDLSNLPSNDGGISTDWVEDTFNSQSVDRFSIENNFGEFTINPTSPVGTSTYKTNVTITGNRAYLFDIFGSLNKFYTLSISGDKIYLNQEYIQANENKNSKSIVDTISNYLLNKAMAGGVVTGPSTPMKVVYGYTDASGTKIYVPNENVYVELTPYYSDSFSFDIKRVFEVYGPKNTKPSVFVK